MSPRAKTIRDTSRIALNYVFAFGAVIAVVLAIHGAELASSLP